MKYLIGALVILALLFLIWWFVSRGKQRQLDEQRAEAASIRAGAQERDATIRGQETFAQQAGERAAFARQEAEQRARQAEESAREAQRVEDEARRHQEELERARLTRDAELRRADELDPDVEVAEGDPRPLPEDLDDDVRPLDDTRVHTPVPTSEPAAEPEPRVHTLAPAALSDRERSDVSAESERDRDSDLGRDRDSGSWGTGAAASAAGAAAVGSAYAATRGDVSDDEAARLASGADYADSEPIVEESASEPVSQWDAPSAQEPVVSEPATADWESAETGWTTEPTDAEWSRTEPTISEWDSTDTTNTSSPTNPTDTTDGTDMTDTSGTADDTNTTDTNTTDTNTTDSNTTDSTEQSGGGMTIINDVEDYASTEPLPAELPAPDEQATSERTEAEDSSDSTYEGPRDDLAQEDVAVQDDAASDEAVTASEPTTEETWEDPADVESSPTADADSTSDSDVRSEGGDATHWPDGTDRVNTVDSESSNESESTSSTDTDAGDDGYNSVSGDQPNYSSEDPGAEDPGAVAESSHDEHTDGTEGSDSDGGGGAGRRISGVDEIRDGGYGVGSAAPFDDGAQPSDHPVQAYNDTRTFRVPGSEGYDSAEPDVWFYDEEAARRAGFNPSQS